jgi:hypothetical protein
VVPYQNSPFFVSAIEAAPFVKVGFLPGLLPGSPCSFGFCLEARRVAVKGLGRVVAGKR